MSSSKFKTSSADLKVHQWEESYTRKENNLFYPKEEVVKFLNRFVRKKIGPNQFIDKLDFSKVMRGLDFGCGTGRQTILMHEFGIEAYGVDISETAIGMAKQIARDMGAADLITRFSTMDGLTLAFKDNYFDLTVSDSVMDSMRFDIAQKLMKEMDRVTKHLMFMSLIAADNVRQPKDYNGEDIVETLHEQGTIQSYFNMAKIRRLIQETDFKMHWCHLITDENVLAEGHHRRYYVVLTKK